MMLVLALRAWERIKAYYSKVLISRRDPFLRHGRIQIATGRVDPVWWGEQWYGGPLRRR